ncbi:hypothetical protein VNO78_06323 [Psophocarpus tetragonolobus]|uniref:non-specific serine/threonine protein kinase n=1 Tax=Psophocarpus tetragonolobus TaxID=3891 RepID=A0AAN9XS30_PSOTE
MDMVAFMIMVASILIPSLRFSIANDSVQVPQSMSDGDTLVSKGGKFVLGFFGPGSSHKRYLGIWYKNVPIQTLVWVANRANPINDSSGILTVNSTGNLVLTQNGSLVWHTNSQKQAQDPMAVLLDNGNLVIRNERETNPEEYLWQSFDYPSDTLLPGMKLGLDLRTGLERRYTAWKSQDDPSPGDVYRVLKHYNYPDIYTMRGTQKLSRFGPWNGLYFSGMPELLNNTIFGLSFVSNKDEIYYTYSQVSNSVITRTVTNQTGRVYRYAWAEELGHKKNTLKIVASTIAAICSFMLLLCYYFISRIRRNNAEKDNSEKDDINLPTFDFSSISNATNYFSEKKILGQGGFGPVYKGMLPDGQEIAVKRLSETSRQGLDEFKNEVKLIAKLQHRNLVKLLGCSIQQDEKLLIYEFMPNRSLDYFIFDSTRRKLLDWTKRFEIINGIARGLLYLHQDSRLKIIHRDLKTSNVLLDSNMNPKISDFGMARIFVLDQDEANTKRIMGTYGYMPPEYAVHGSFSVKSDVFSFGVIVLETISGRKIRGFCDPFHHLNLLGHAWRLWIEKRPIEFMDDLLDNNAALSEIVRYIHIGLLCVQQRPEDRPNISSVVLMLNGEKLLPEPSQPGFYSGKGHPTITESSPGNIAAYSLNEISNSLLEAR